MSERQLPATGKQRASCIPPGSDSPKTAAAKATLDAEKGKREAEAAKAASEAEKAKTRG